jgi:hypothetical protein
MRLGPLWLLIFLSGCGFSPDFDRFAKLCQDRARVIIHDRDGWKLYLHALNSQNWQREVQGQAYLVPSPVGNLRSESDFSRWFAETNGEGSFGGSGHAFRAKPYRNNKYVYVGPKLAVTIVDYTLSWNGFGSRQNVTCTTSHPEVYGLKAHETRRNSN